MKFKRLLCKIFGHRLGKEMYDTVEQVTIGNYVMRRFRKCSRCGAMIMVGKYNKY